jgi:hypothetical protein
VASTAGESTSVGADEVPWYRRRRVHVALGLLVAALTAFWAAERAAQGVRENLDAQLRGAGAGAVAGLVVVEAEQLSALRAATFTVGVGHALRTLDIPTLNRLVAPVQANSNVPMVDVVLPDGRVVLAVRSKGAPPPTRTRAGLPALVHALREANDKRSGRFSQVVVLRTGPTLLTIGPVKDGGRAVGAVLVMTPLADVLGRLSQQVGTTLSAYAANGVPIATTASYRPADLDRNAARELIGGGAVVMRNVNGSKREAVGRLIVDHQPDALLGTSLVDNSWATGRAVLLYAAVGLICTVLIAGSFATRVVRRQRV